MPAVYLLAHPKNFGAQRVRQGRGGSQVSCQLFLLLAKLCSKQALLLQGGECLLKLPTASKLDLEPASGVPDLGSLPALRMQSRQLALQALVGAPHGAQLRGAVLESALQLVDLELQLLHSPL